MIRKIMSYVKQYKKESIIAPVAMVGEVGMEVAIPFVMSKMIDVGINGYGRHALYHKNGPAHDGMAIFSLPLRGFEREVCGRGEHRPWPPICARGVQQGAGLFIF